MTKKTFTLLAIALAVNLTWAQEPPLKRKASLGILLEAVNDSIALANHLKTTQGIYIQRVFEGSTAEELGIEAGDIITQINTLPVNTIQDVMQVSNNLRANNPLSIIYYRKGKTKKTNGNAIGRPLEKSEFADIYYETVTYEGNRLRSILHMPKGVKRPPVVFYIQGYMCQSVELSTVPEHTIRKLIDDWVKAGFAVYRIEKPGMGDSDCSKGCYDLNFNEEITAFKQGLITLQMDQRIDADNIFLFGHSIGGLIAPIIAKDLNPKGVITYGCMVNTWFEYMQELTRVQGEMFHLPYAEIERDIRTATPFWYALLIDQKTPEEILTNKVIYDMLKTEGTLESFQAGQFMQRHYTYWSGIQKIALVNEWAQVKSKVLALYGEFDIQALNANHIYTIANIVNTAHPGNATAKIIPGADHGFVRFNSMDENVNALNSNSYWNHLLQNYHPGIGTTTINWMKTHLNE